MGKMLILNPDSFTKRFLTGKLLELDCGGLYGKNTIGSKPEISPASPWE
jgi:hypothetical protein